MMLQMDMAQEIRFKYLSVENKSGNNFAVQSENYL